MTKAELAEDNERLVGSISEIRDLLEADKPAKARQKCEEILEEYEDDEPEDGDEE